MAKLILWTFVLPADHQPQIGILGDRQQYYSCAIIVFLDLEMVRGTVE